MFSSTNNWGLMLDLWITPSMVVLDRAKEDTNEIIRS